MDIFARAFEVVAAQLGIAVVGFFVFRGQIQDKESILKFLSTLGIDLALPFFSFSIIVKNFDPGSFRQWYVYPLWWLGLTAGLALLSLFFTLVSRGNREFFLSLFFQNGIFFPVALLTGLFGANSAEVAVLFIFMMFYPSFFFLVIPAVLGMKQKARWQRVLSPVFLATVLAVLLKLGGLDVYLPNFLKSTFLAVGALSTPIIFLILGGNIYLDLAGTKKIYAGRVAWFVLVKNFIFPALGLLAIKYLRIPQPISLILILQCAVPPLTVVPILVGRAGGNRAFVNQLFVASALVSIVSLPLFLYLFNRLGF
ncbi:MAG: AEC family transporter [Candidatus Saccharicenans sp.]|jgi:predicted permease|nr:AEC family transporter [Candidatus Saccharicenans sp.]MDH7575339.1 AEC family transporter [Candidatus Saccharicenans sp.]